MFCLQKFILHLTLPKSVIPEGLGRAVFIFALYIFALHFRPIFSPVMFKSHVIVWLFVCGVSMFVNVLIYDTGVIASVG